MLRIVCRRNSYPTIRYYGGYLVYCLFFVCTVTDFSAVEKDSGMKVRTLVQLLSGQVFFHFDELWLA